MSQQIQVTNEISIQLASLKKATIDSGIDFTRAVNITFADNKELSSIAEYQNVISTIGTLSERYKELLDRDVKACEQTVENTREFDRRVAQAMRG